MDNHDKRRDELIAKSKRPKGDLHTISSARKAWNSYREYNSKSLSAYSSYMRHNNLTHHARFEAYATVAEEWETALETWFGHEELAQKDWGK